MNLRLLTLLALAPWAAFAQANEPIDIEAQSLTVKHNSGQATFSGNVHVTQGGLSLTAPTLNVTYGAAGQGDIKEIKATGGVTIIRGNGAEQATGTTAIYNPQSQQLVLTGAVALQRGSSTLSGDKLVYDIATGNAKVTNSQGPVKARFTPQSK